MSNDKVNATFHGGDDDIGTVRWFGQSWHAPINDPRAEVPVPTDHDCTYCHVPIVSDDSGVTIPSQDGRVVFHRTCFFKELGLDEYAKPF